MAVWWLYHTQNGKPGDTYKSDNCLAQYILFNQYAMFEWDSMSDFRLCELSLSLHIIAEIKPFLSSELYISECEVGKYDANCVMDCPCLTGVSCDATSGECYSGDKCGNGWMGYPQCNIGKCKPYMFKGNYCDISGEYKMTTN